MLRYRAAWVVPIVGRPIRNGWIAVENGRVLAVEPATSSQTVDIDLGSVAVMPGLVNAHTHLELSHLRGLVPRSAAMPLWVSDLLDKRARHSRATSADAGALSPDRAIEQAVFEARASGTTAIGEVSNTLASVGPLDRSPLSAVVFHELIAFNPGDAEALVRRAAETIAALPDSSHVRVTLAAHAPYSVAPSLFITLRAELERSARWPSTVHIAESSEEGEFLQTGGGSWRALLETLGAWNPTWQPPRCSAVEYLDRLGFVDPRVVLVHGVHLTPADLARLAGRGVTVVACPRSNEWTGAGRPPLEGFYQAGVPVAVGTDSLASVSDLNMFSELAAMRRLASSIPAARLLESATLRGATALGFEELGTIEPGKRADLLAIRIPDEGLDVEEYLVGGIAPEQIAWISGILKSA